MAAGGGWPMRVVRMGTMSRYGHACVVETVEPAGPAVTIIEPMPKGCRRRVALPGEFVWSDVPLTDEQRRVIVDYARQTIGLPYDWRAIAGFLLRFWGLKFRLPIQGAKPDKRLICSELVVWAYRQAGVDLAPGKQPGDVSPGDLDEFLDNRRRSTP